MNDEPAHLPATVCRLHALSEAISFPMACDNRTGSLLRTLAASKPTGRILELGTGTGVGAAWLLAGMSPDARLVTVEREPELARLAAQEFGDDERVDVVTCDADAWIAGYLGPGIDLVFVDCRPGKFHARSALLNHLNHGGLYVADDLLPQLTWPEDHQPRVESFLTEIHDHTNLQVTLLAWSSGLVLAART
ncbi:MAG: O-methyltransferase [Pseudonocardiaceae bacterium]